MLPGGGQYPPQPTIRKRCVQPSSGNRTSKRTSEAMYPVTLQYPALPSAERTSSAASILAGAPSRPVHSILASSPQAETGFTTESVVASAAADQWNWRHSSKNNGRNSAMIEFMVLFIERLPRLCLLCARRAPRMTSDRRLRSGRPFGGATVDSLLRGPSPSISPRLVWQSNTIRSVHRNSVLW